uniref:Peptidase M14 carboxypeptidase A domain-containing protein n=1 Tax=Romanomermis culicivorax TaxID=13658 RepID=A0A915J622_ROMCU
MIILPQKNLRLSNVKVEFILSVAQDAEISLEKVHGRKYRIEASWSLYPASGTSDDWAKAAAGIKYSFTIELRPGEQANDESKGFILSSDQIIPTGQELFAGLNSLGAKLLEEQQ